MLKNSKHMIFRHSNDCVFAFIGEENKAGLDFSKVFPRNDELHDVLFKKNGSHYDTAFTLNSSTSTSFLFVADMKLDARKLPSIPFKLADCKTPEFMSEQPGFAYINLMRQGTTNFNGKLDIKLECARCTDGIHRRVIIKQYFKRTSRINLMKTSFSLTGNEFIGSYDKLFISNDTYSNLVSLWLNGEKKYEEHLNPATTNYMQYNVQLSSSTKLNCIEVGDTNEALLLKSAILFNAKVDPVFFGRIIHAVE